MKLKNIALGIGFLVAMFSCSMEDDIQSGMDNKEIISEQYAYFDFSLKGTNGLNTKSQVSDNGKEAATESESIVTSCFVAILNGENILASRYYDTDELQVDETDRNIYILNKHILIKAPTGNPALTCFAVANVVDETMQNKLLAATTSAQLNSIAINGSLTADKLVKVGSSTLSDYRTTSKTTHDINESGEELSSIGGIACNQVAIQVHQRAAAIEFVGFSLKKKNETTNQEEILNASDLKLELININTRTALTTTGTAAIQTQSSFVGKSTDENVARLYAYENITDQNTSFKIHYTVNGEPKTTSVFTIKTPDTNGSFTDEKGNKYNENIVANHLYKISVNVVNKSVNVEVQCTTANWIKNSYDLGDISVTTK